MAFAFVPRTVKKPVEAAGIKTAPVAPLPTALHPQDAIPTRFEPFNATWNASVASYTEEDYVALIGLALSTHTLWSDPDLRRSVDWSTQSVEGEDITGNEGFIPLRHLLRRSPVLKPFDLDKNEVAVAKALRAKATDVFDVRLLVSSEGPSRKSDVGNYEIRRKDYAAALEACRGFSREMWEKRTIYMENIPIEYKTIPRTSQFISKLLPADASIPSVTRVQSIILPPHHMDGPNDIPKCKGFALVTLLHEEEAGYLLKTWPWDRRKELTEMATGHPEAHKFGFRTLSKTRWEELKEEYLQYRQHLLDSIASSQEVPVASSSTMPVPKPMVESAPASTPRPAAGLNPHSPYPPGCLVFARHVHPETNKTTLRNLLSSAYKDLSGTNGIDYVDYTKRMDSCHIRLKTPSDAQTLVTHFSRDVWQVDALDDTGSNSLPVGGGGKALVLEVVEGKREEIYWERIPERIRMGAVRAALEAQTAQPDEERDEEESKRKKKRRKVK